MRVVVALLLSTIAGAAFANTITVTTTADVVANDAQCSLREAIEAANTNVGVSGCTGGSGADTIVLSAGTYEVVGAPEDANASGDLDVTESVTLRGVGADMTILSAGSGAQDRVLDLLDADETLSVIDLSITNGIAASGNDGGGIRAVGFLNVVRCAITGNAAGEGPGGSAGSGGGISIGKADGLFISNSSVAGNKSGACTGSGPARPGDGAGIEMRGGRIEGSLLAANEAGDPGSCGISGAYGGAILNTGNALSILNTSITGNTSAVGGGLYAVGGSVTIRQSSFVGNTGSEGGAAIDAVNLDLVLENSTISGNVATSDLGAIHLARGLAVPPFSAVFSHATIVNNLGGGLSAESFGPPGLTVSLRNTVLSSNKSATMTLGYDCLRSVVNPATLVSSGFNVFGSEPISASRGCPFNPLIDLVQQDAVVGSLVKATLDNDVGSATQFLLPLEGSALIDQGTCTNAAGQPVLVDQRGNPRVCACDVGAIEIQKPTLRVSDVAVSLACTNGPATRIEALDCAGNVTATKDVCVSGGGIVGPAGENGITGATGGLGASGTQGEQGEPGRNGTKIKTEKLATGDEACREGGIRITVGDDQNADGEILGPEISDSQTLCNPPQPAAGCASTSAVPFAMLAGFMLLRRRRRG